MDKTLCPICGSKEVKIIKKHDPVSEFYNCPICGQFEFTESEICNPTIDRKKLRSFLFYNGFKSKSDNHESRYYTTLKKEKCDEFRLSELNKNDIYGHPVHVDNDIINAWYPRNFSEKVNKILLKLDDMTPFPGMTVKLTLEEVPGLTFGKKDSEYGNDKFWKDELLIQAEFFMKYLNDAGYIIDGIFAEGNAVDTIMITPSGYQVIEGLQKNASNGRDVLVAMKFGDDTMLLRNSIKKGISDAGYNPILIDEVEHNELITPELLSYIKKSKFVVVDLSHQNNGAYFEEGYAMGMGKPVIQLCKKGVSLHFDIAQKNTIMWEQESDIPLRLANRIKATIE